MSKSLRPTFLLFSDPKFDIDLFLPTFSCSPQDKSIVQAKVKSPMFVELPKGFGTIAGEDNVLQLNMNFYRSCYEPLAWFEAL